MDGVPTHAIPQLGERYVGIDPGLHRTGYAVLERGRREPRLLEGGVISSTVENSLHKRVHELSVGLQEVLDDFQPCCMAIEQIFSTGKYPKPALLMAHARGAILLAAAERNMQVVHYTPTQIKRLLTGSGRASKEQMQHAIKNELRLDAIPEPNDVADASAVALCHYYSSRITNINALT